MAFHTGHVRDPCLDCLNALSCLFLCCAAVDTVSHTASNDRTIGIALGIIFAIATIVGAALLATTSSNVWTERGFYAVSNARYIPFVVVGGGIFTLLAFSAAAQKNKI